jgi:hypothetical protein
LHQPFISAQNLGRREEALQAWNKAVSLVDRTRHH